jgi:hypothetical protein
MITPCPIENKKMNGASQRKYNQGIKAGYTIINIMSGNFQVKVSALGDKGLGLLTLHLYYRHYHLFHTHPTVLKSITVIIHVVIIIIGIT